MTHEERVWELYKGFVIGEFHNCQFGTNEAYEHEKIAEEYHNMAEVFVTAFEKIPKEG